MEETNGKYRSMPAEGPDASQVPDEVEVAVVGAGPSGLTAAAMLAGYGVRVTVLDGAPGPAEHSRAAVVHARTLEALDRANLFLIPLDDRRRWYRYHHLFADVLRARLLDEHPERMQALQRRASAWFAEHDQPAEAVEHAVVAVLRVDRDALRRKLDQHLLLRRVRLPIIVVEHEPAVLVSDLKRRVRQRVRNSKLRQGRPNRTDRGPNRCILDDETGDHQFIARLDETSRRDVDQPRR